MLRIIIFFIIPLFAFAKLHVSTSIPPIAHLISIIGAERIEVHSLLQPGDSPHAYTPPPSKLSALSKSDLYFAVGVEFESQWLKRFASLNPTMDIIHLDKGIAKHHTACHTHHDHTHAHDPHIWTSIENLLLIARNIARTLSKYDPKGAELYTQKLKIYTQKLNQTDHKIRTLINQAHTDTFVALHPSWGYFAHTYGLRQLSVESEGKPPSPRQMAQLFRSIQKYRVRLLIVDPISSRRLASTIAQRTKLHTLSLSALYPDTLKAMVQIAASLDGNLP